MRPVTYKTLLTSDGFFISNNLRMKQKSSALTTLFLTAILGVFAPRNASAQGTLFLSNLGETSFNGIVAASDQWLAMQFTTGTTPAGYNLDSVGFLSGGTLGSPSGFSLSIYTDNSGKPGSSLAALSGSANPSALSSIYSYTASGVTLSSLTPYWVVAKAATPKATGGYAWAITSSTNYFSDDGWSTVTLSAGSADAGSSWVPTGGIYQFSVEATAVPEPQTFALLGLGLSAFLLRRRK